MPGARGTRKNKAESLPDGSLEPTGEKSNEKFQDNILTKAGGAGSQGKGAASV